MPNKNKVQAAPAAKAIPQVDDPNERQSIVDNIREMDNEQAVIKANIKTLREQIEEIKQSHSAFAEVEEKEQEVKALRENLRLALLSDADYNNAMEQMADLKSSLSDLQDMLSLHVVEYYTTTGAHQIEIGDNGDARDVVVTGKLGGGGKYQTNLFSDGGTADPSKQATLI